MHSAPCAPRGTIENEVVKISLGTFEEVRLETDSYLYF